MGNITLIDELLARSLITKVDDIWANKIGIPYLSNEIYWRSYYAAFEYKGIWIYFAYETEQDRQEITAMVYENFIKDQYKSFDVKDKIVIDIGAAVGDSAIYFALHDAKHVYAFEPYSSSYKKLKQNVILNKLQKKITVINQALAAKPGTMRIAIKEAMGGSKLEESKDGKIIKITTLSEIVERFKIKEAVLKLDAEGAEYDIIMNSIWTSEVEALLRFKEIMLEYHFGYIDIKQRLERIGFRTSHTIPRMVFYDPKMRLGLLKASKL